MSTKIILSSYSTVVDNIFMARLTALCQHMHMKFPAFMKIKGGKKSAVHWKIICCSSEVWRKTIQLWNINTEHLSCSIQACKHGLLHAKQLKDWHNHFSVMWWKKSSSYPKLVALTKDQFGCILHLELKYFQNQSSLD